MTASEYAKLALSMHPKAFQAFSDAFLMELMSNMEKEYGRRVNLRIGLISASNTINAWLVRLFEQIFSPRNSTNSA